VVGSEYIPPSIELSAVAKPGLSEATNSKQNFAVTAKAIGEKVIYGLSLPLIRNPWTAAWVNGPKLSTVRYMLNQDSYTICSRN